MKPTRRNFLKSSFLTAAAAASGISFPQKLFSFNILENKKKMKLSFRPFTMELRHTFTVAEASRTVTPAVLTEIEYDGIVGYGEAALPPYLGDSQESVMEFLKRVDLSKYESPFMIEDIMNDIDHIRFYNTAAKAAVDIALHDLVGKLMNQPWYNIWGYDKNKAPNTTFTIGIDKADVVKEKTKEAKGFKILKVKLGRDNDKEMIESVRAVTNVPLTADPNQGWKDRYYALDMIHWLKEQGVVYVEQPMAKERLEDHAWLTEKSPLPILADESCQRLSDLEQIKGAYSGIVIKLMKCTGMREANKMITLARAYNMKILIGCMTETSCAISAASHLSPACDWADLDGNLLIANDIYKGTTVVNGKLTLSDLPG
ncbi:MAG: dipeptide epimerase, partial [Bacteroidetes bacterium]|nr:dipeptide epimerase [Bacteroidota bacterium]